MSKIWKLIEERLNIHPKYTPNIIPRHTAGVSLRPAGIKTKRQTNPDTSFLKGFNRFNCEKNLFDWQKQIYRAIFNGENVFVSVSPAGGKTFPVTCAISKRIIKEYFKNLPSTSLPAVPSKNVLNRIKTTLQYLKSDDTTFYPKFSEVPLKIKIMWVTPLQQLNFQLYNEIVYTIVGNALLSNNKLFKEFSLLDPQLIEEFLRMYIGTDAGSTPIYSNKPSTSTLVDICTYEKATNNLNRFRYDIIVVDEFQEAFRSDDKRRLDAFFDIFSYKYCKQMICLTGSTNEVLIDEFIKWNETFFKRKFVKLQFNKDVAGNRSKLSVIPISNMSPSNLDNIVKDIITAKLPNNLFILFSKKLIYKTCEKLIKELPIINHDLFKDQSQKIEPYDSPFHDEGRFKLYLAHYLKEKIQSERRKSNKPLLSPEDLNRRVTQLIGTMSKTEYNKYKFDKEFREYLQTKGIDTRSKSQIREDSFLVDCLKRGFGFIVGGSVEQGEKSWVDQYLLLNMTEKELVQELFRKKKIYVLFATEAVGIGVNLKVRNLYIPTVRKFDGTVMTSLDTSSLLQLVQRAGRDSSNIPEATIYCSEDDYDYIKCILDKEHYMAVQNPLDLKAYLKPKWIPKNLQTAKYMLKQMQIDFEIESGSGDCQKYIK